MAASRRRPSPWGWTNSLIALLIFLDLCSVTYYLWALPPALFDDRSKMLSTVAQWVAAVLGYFGIRYKVGKRTSMAAVLRLRPVVLCTVAATAAAWFFFLPFHGTTFVIRNAASGGPVAGATVKVHGDKGILPTRSREDGKLRISWRPAARHDLLIEAGNYEPLHVTVHYGDFLAFAEREVPLTPVPPAPVKAAPPAPAAVRLYPVFFSSEPQGANIVIDGKPWGPTPRSIRLTAGSHTLELRLTGYRMKPEVIQVPGQQALARDLAREAAQGSGP